MCLAFSLLEALFYHNCQGERTPILKAFYSFELSPNGEIRGCTIRAADWSCALQGKGRVLLSYSQMAPARGWGGARRWKSREKQRQNTVKKNNRRDHRRPGRRIIRILKRKGETFRIALLWGGDGRGVADSHLFQPNKHNQSIHQCCCKLCPYKNCIKGGCSSSVHHRRFQWTRLKALRSECVRGGQQREREINGWAPSVTKATGSSLRTAQSSLCRWSCLHGSFPTHHPASPLPDLPPKTAMSSLQAVWLVHLGTFLPKGSQVDVLSADPTMSAKARPYCGETLKMVLREKNSVTPSKRLMI